MGLRMKDRVNTVNVKFLSGIGITFSNFANVFSRTLKGNKIQSLPSRTFEGVDKLETL